jgi:hypothetical protein
LTSKFGTLYSAWPGTLEELRVLTGDFISPDEIVANALSPVALERGCAVLFDEQPGADILRTPWQEA